ncbi:MAG: hypothetical protein JSV20_07545 [Candidatus Bathyarchaeota archaeon]|nr:MAG: hypothetical protein JSV20_07545 [Candidatus Bathyarchaeota archaeon]
MRYKTRRFELSKPSFISHDGGFREAVEFIENKLKKKVYMIGSNAIHEYGLPIWRPIEDFDLYVPLTPRERNRLIMYMRRRQISYPSSLTGLKFHLIGDTITEFITPVRESSWDERSIEVKGCKVYLPPLEDLILLKLISPRIKDRQDTELALLFGNKKIDFDKLTKRHKKVGTLQY